MEESLQPSSALPSPDPSDPSGSSTPAGSADKSTATDRSLDYSDEPEEDIRVEVSFDSCINYAMQQNDIPVVRWLKIENGSARAFDDLTVRISIDSEITEPWEAHVRHLPGGTTWTAESVDLHLKPERLLRQEESEATTLHARILHRGAEVMHEEFPLSILAANEWGGLRSLPEILAAFCQPNNPAVQRVLSSTRTLLEKKTGDPSLAGYARPERVRPLAEALWSACCDLGIAYLASQRNYEGESHKVRTPDQVIENGLGTEIDLAVLIASCLELVGLNPVFCVLDESIVVGTWMHDESFPRASIEEGKRLRRRVNNGEILLFDPIALTNRPAAAFGLAVRAAQSRIEEPESFRFCIDVRAARKAKIRPLASRSGLTLGGDNYLEFTPLAIDPADAPSESGEPAETPIEDLPTNRIEKWKRHLLDLSLRNRLLNYQPNKKSVPIQIPDLTALEMGLSSRESYAVLHRSREMSTADRTSGRSGKNDAPYLLKELKERRLRTSMDKKELNSRLLDIYRTSRLSVEETGANILYLAVGFLRWFDKTTPDRRLRAPILLLPLTIDRDPQTKSFAIKAVGAEPRINVTLLEKLKTDFKQNITGLEEIYDKNSDLDIPGVLARWTNVAAQHKDWSLESGACIGLFSFTKFLMWLDLASHTDLLLRNPVVRYLVERPDAAFDSTEFPQPENLDKKQPEELLLPMDADSSQITAVVAAEEGKSFVLEGPPGTGKSQTITNLIAHCLGKGKRILFVAEKEAALSVVQRRLASVGLDPFCLQLYSNKVNKQEVLNQLKESLEVAGAKGPGEWQERAERLAAIRGELNRYVEELHGKRPLGRSVHEVIARIIGLRDVQRVPLALDKAETIDAETFERHLELVDQLSAAARSVGDPAHHPLRNVTRTDWDVDLPEKVTGSVTGCLEALVELEEGLVRCARVLGVIDEKTGAVLELSRNELLLLEEAGQHLLESPFPERRLLIEPGFVDRSAQFRRILELGAQTSVRRSALEARWKPELFQQDLALLLSGIDAAANAAPVIAWTKKRGLRRRFARWSQTGKASFEELREVVHGVREIVHAEEQLQAATEDMSAYFGDQWHGLRTDWAELTNKLAWCERFHQLLSGIAGSVSVLYKQMMQRWTALATDHSAQFGKNHAFRDHLKVLSLARQAFLDRWNAYTKIVSLDAACVFGSDDEKGFLRRIRNHLDSWQKSFPDLRDWFHFQRIRRDAAKTMLAPIIAACDAGVVPVSEASKVFERSFYEIWLQRLHKTDTSFRNFNGSEHLRKVRRFRELEAEFIKLTRSFLKARLAANIPAPGTGTTGNSELGILEREIRKKRQIMPIRRLFERLPTLLPRLKPCVLMSPLSAAQYLSAGLQSFDIVVFDEASQIPIWDAIGAIARGKQVVVVGDSKQLPPTSFFATIDDEEGLDDDDFLELDSLLEECIASRLPTMDLRWHYRSRHESLIAFSNSHYYGGRLETFTSPMAESKDLGIGFHYVEDAVHDRGDTATNRAEATAVANEVVKRLKKLGNPKKMKEPPGLGIVTFSLPQQRLMEEILDEAREKYPQIDVWFTDAVPEPVFIKNLESVQGDERDTIFLSVGFGPDSRGRISMNFGPLCRDGGERRLNVAITRARRQLVLFSSIRSRDIDLSRTRAVGARHLKAFLDYAEHGPQASEPSFWMGNQEGPERTIENDLAGRLERRGYTVERQVGCSDYRIDVAVRHPKEEGRYILGVECDGTNYRNASTARDRDRLRAFVLRDLGWHLHRVWSPDWWIQPEREVDKIEASIQAALRVEAGVPRVRVQRIAAGSPGTPTPSAPRSAAPPAAAPPAPGKPAAQSSDTPEAHAAQSSTPHPSQTQSRPPRKTSPRDAAKANANRGQGAKTSAPRTKKNAKQASQGKKPAKPAHTRQTKSSEPSDRQDPARSQESKSSGRDLKQPKAKGSRRGKTSEKRTPAPKATSQPTPKPKKKKKARVEGSKSTSQEVAPAPQSAPPAAPPTPPHVSSGSPYRAFPIVPPSSPPEQAPALSAIVHMISEVVACESPVHIVRAIRRVAKHFGFRKIDNTAVQRIRQALGQLPEEARPFEHGDFLWATGADPEALDTFRTHRPNDSDLRTPQEIPSQEIANAIGDVLKQSVSMPLADLSRAVAELFGHPADDPNMNRSIQNVVNACTERGFYLVEDDRIRSAA